MSPVVRICGDAVAVDALLLDPGSRKQHLLDYGCWCRCWFLCVKCVLVVHREREGREKKKRKTQLLA